MLHGSKNAKLPNLGQLNSTEPWDAQSSRNSFIANAIDSAFWMAVSFDRPQGQGIHCHPAFVKLTDGIARTP